MNEKLDKIKERINEMKREKEELRERYDYLVEQVKKETDKHAEDIEYLKNELSGITSKAETKEEKLSGFRTFMLSLEKSIASLESRQAAMGEKLGEDMKLMERELNAQLSERAKAIGVTLSAQVKDSVDKGLKESRSIRESAKKTMKKNAEYEKAIDGLSGEISSLQRSISELGGKNDAMKSTLKDKIDDIEESMKEEFLKIKELESRLNRDVKDFEKFSAEQKAGMREFEAGVAGKLDMYAVKKENLRRDFEELEGRFKSFAGHIDSLKERDSFFDNRLKTMELNLENFKKAIEERMLKLGDDQKEFSQNLIARMNDASEKIVERLSNTENKTMSEIVKEAGEIKVFRAHMTQFMNDFVNNYEKRFEKMKNDMDEALVLVEQRAREQVRQHRPMIVE